MTVESAGCSNTVSSYCSNLVLFWLVGRRGRVDVGGSKKLMGNVVFSQLEEERRGLNSVAVNDPKAHLGPAPPHPMMASSLETQAKAKFLSQPSSG